MAFCRSALYIVPRDWEDRFQWIRYDGLLIKLKERLQIDQSQLDQIEVVDWHESKPN